MLERELKSGGCAGMEARFDDDDDDDGKGKAEEESV
jgi:hypothetical protein